MEEIASFKKDHTKLKKGLYLTRDVFLLERGVFDTTTYDVRMKTPYEDTPLNPATAHTIEHCLACYLRNHRSDVIYVGPMGCMTGFYVVLSGRKEIVDIHFSLQKAFEWITETSYIPGASKEECGNCEFMDLQDAKREAWEYLKVL